MTKVKLHQINGETELFPQRQVSRRPLDGGKTPLSKGTQTDEQGSGALSCKVPAG